MNREIEVWADWRELESPVPMGQLRSSLSRGKEVFSFTYLELVEFITRQGAQPTMDLEELWRRIVFSIAVHNTDDHLRNHGFLLSPGGWCISPAYDLNPDPDGAGLSLNISESDNALSFDLALEVAPYFRLTPRLAESILGQVRDAVCGWKKHARGLGITEAEQEIMTKAFEM